MKNKLGVIARPDDSGSMFGVYFEYKGKSVLYKKYCTFAAAERRAIEIGNKIKCQWLDLKLERDIFNIDEQKK